MNIKLKEIVDGVSFNFTDDEIKEILTLNGYKVFKHHWCVISKEEAEQDSHLSEYSGTTEVAVREDSNMFLSKNTTYESISYRNIFKKVIIDILAGNLKKSIFTDTKSLTNAKK